MISEYKYERKDVFSILGEGAPFARGSAATIKLNSALMLVTMLRNFLSFIRGTFLGTYLPIDKNIVFHKWIGWTILLFTIIHM
jgi:predicted ferric reductase